MLSTAPTLLSRWIIRPKGVATRGLNMRVATIGPILMLMIGLDNYISKVSRVDLLRPYYNLYRSTIIA